MRFSKYNLLIPSENNNGYILFNTLYGHCINIKPSLVDIIAKNKPEELDEETRNQFVGLNILVDNAIDERKVIDYFRSREKYSSSYVSSTVLLTWACNLKCIYCFESSEEKSIGMGADEADKYIKFLINIANERRAKTIAVCLFGGEPLVNFEIGDYILSHLKKYCEDNNMNLLSSVITNGTLITEDIIDKLIKYNCGSIQITLDGLKQIHDSRRMYKNDEGTFDTIIESLNILNKRSDVIHTVIRVNIDKSNINETYQLLEYIGINGINLTNCVVDFGIVRGMTNACVAYSGHCLTEEEIGDALYDLWNFAEKQGFKYNIRPMRKWMYCGLYGDNQFTVAPNCEVYKCWEHTGQKEHFMGVIDANGNFVNVQYAFYDWMSNDPLKNNTCSQCVYLPSCGGGCAVVSYNNNKSYHSTGCFKVKGVIEKQVLKYVETVESSIIK